jgi:hypothetical protein
MPFRACDSLEDLCRVCKTVRGLTVIVAEAQGAALKVAAVDVPCLPLTMESTGCKLSKRSYHGYERQRIGGIRCHFAGGAPAKWQPILPIQLPLLICSSNF